MTRLYCFGKQCTHVYIAGGPFLNENVSKATCIAKCAATRELYW